MKNKSRIKKRLKLLGLLLGVLILFGGLVYNYVFNAKHRNISAEEATVILSAKAFYKQFETNEALATTNYLDKVIETKGQITLIEKENVVLSDKVQVNFNPNQISKLKKGQSLTIKGRCVGYDELLEMVKIDQATVINR